MSQKVVEDLGDLLIDYLEMVIDFDAIYGNDSSKGIYSIKELRVTHLVFRCWRLGESCTLTRIAKETGISKTTVSRAITTLIGNGLLREELDPEDGRRRLLLPTELGEEAMGQIHQWLESWAQRIARTMAEEDGTIIAAEPLANAGQRSADAASR